MEPYKNDMMRARMTEYADICRRLAQKHNCVLIDLQEMFDKYFEFCHSSSIAWDRIHPNRVGADLIAREFLNKCQFDFNH